MQYISKIKQQANNKAFLVFILLMCSPLYVLSCTHKVQDNTNWFDLIMERIRERHQDVNIEENDNKYTKYYLSILNEDGSFSDIDYNDNSQTNWKPLAHLNRMKPMVISYTNPTSKYYQDENLYNSIVKMFQLWYDKHPLSTNWYNQQIASPQRVGVLLILMRSGEKQIPANLEKNLFDRMEAEGGRPDQPGSPGTGANKLDIATHWIYRGCLLEDESTVSFGAEQVYYPVFLTTEQGLQPDFSYQQHGNQLHIGGYGYAFVEGVSSIASYTTGTPYEMSKEKLDYLSQFVRKGYLPTIRGEYFLYNVVGRSMSRKGALNQKIFIPILERMTNIDPEYKVEYEAAIARLSGVKNSSFKIEPMNRQFWRSDYMLHQRPQYTFDVRGSSIYSTRNENGNREGLKGYFLVDGATEITIRGNEYADIFGVWDWNRIPGTTTPQMDSIPLPKHWEQPGISKFSGGVSDGLYGVATYVYDDPDFSVNTSAKKSWFMFDDEIVCLGADIKSTSDYEINTTLNQSLLNNEVWFKSKNKTPLELTKGIHNLSDVSWLYHDNIGYYFPKPTSIIVSNDIQTGSWYSFNNAQSKDIESKDIFKAWINHGKNPNTDDYQYILLPVLNVTALDGYNSDNIEIINNAKTQAVYHKGLDILGIVFYEAGEYFDGYTRIVVDKPCVMMVNGVKKDTIKVYVSDPSRLNSRINISADFSAIGDTKNIECILPVKDDPYAGSTKMYELNKN